MAWNHDDVRPNRSRDELLGDVIRRGEGIRRRRRVVAGLGGCIALLLAVAGVAAVVGPESSVTNLAAGGPATTHGAVFSPAVGGTTVAVELPTTTTVAPEPTTDTTVARPVATTIAAAAEPDPTTTVPVVPTVPPPAQPRCGPAQMQVTLTFTKPSYAPGEQVVGHALLRNTSGAACYYYSFQVGHGFHDATGKPVGAMSALIADNFMDTAFAPDETMTENLVWDQTICDPVTSACPPAPPGTYSGTANWSFDGPPVEATTAFIVAAP